MGFGIFLFHIKKIIGSDHLDVILFGKPEKHIIYPFLFFKPVAHQFDVKIISEEIVPPFKRLLCVLLSFVQNQVRNFAL